MEKRIKCAQNWFLPTGSHFLPILWLSTWCKWAQFRGFSFIIQPVCFQSIFIQWWIDHYFQRNYKVKYYAAPLFHNKMLWKHTGWIINLNPLNCAHLHHVESQKMGRKWLQAGKINVEHIWFSSPKSKRGYKNRKCIILIWTSKNILVLEPIFVFFLQKRTNIG